MKRRRFLRYTAAAAGAASLPLLTTLGAGCKPKLRKRARQGSAGTGTGSGSAQGIRIPPRRSAGEAKVLRAHEWITLEAVCARILPTDKDPGATEAGVVGYIDEQLSHAPVDGFLRMIRVGLRRVDLIARRTRRRRFADLDAAGQDKVINLTMRSRRMGGRYTGVRFFQVLVTLTLEGFLCDPIYGGNRDEVGWKLVGHVPQQPRPRAPYRGREA